VEAPFSVSEPRLRLLYKEYLKMQDGSAAAAAAGQEVNEMPVNYCVCCYHGTEMLQADNTTLLSQFVADNGTVLPKRLTKLCSKHQRAMASTIKQSRALNFLPFHSKLHPKLRFTSVTPQATQEASDARSKSAAYGGDREGARGSSLL
jgi:small subunit ribosomal protein S18